MCAESGLLARSLNFSHFLLYVCCSAILGDSQQSLGDTQWEAVHRARTVVGSRYNRRKKVGRSGFAWAGTQVTLRVKHKKDACFDRNLAKKIKDPPVFFHRPPQHTRLEGSMKDRSPIGADLVKW